MFAKERQNFIVELVNKEGTVRVKELSERFDVTEDCIRKDLTALEKKGLLQKTYGGAMQVRKNVHELFVSQRKEKNIEEKQHIAGKAFELIKDGDMIFLDVSTTNIELAKLLVQSSLNVVVVTNMFEVVKVLMVPSTIKLIFIGGTFNRGYDGFIGSITINQLINYHFDLAFMGVVGVDLFQGNVEVYSVEDGLTKKAVLDQAERSYMMLETRKLNQSGNYKYSKIVDFTGTFGK